LAETQWVHVAIIMTKFLLAMCSTREGHPNCVLVLCGCRNTWIDCSAF